MLKWYSGIFNTPNNALSEYSLEHRYCRCLCHEPGTSSVYEMYYDMVDNKWGYIMFEGRGIHFFIANIINPPYYWCYLRDVETLILNNSEFPIFK